MNKYKYIIIILITISISCSLDRENPLDPIGNPTIQKPPTVDSLWVNNYILTWLKPSYVVDDSTILANGYFIYGSKQYDGKYDRLSISYNCNDTTIDVENYFYAQDYRWFKVSSYKIFSDTLEGYLSNATPVY